MKYEPVFGDQSLFDGAQDDAEIAAKFEGGIAFFPKQKPSSKVFFVSGVELAMRRIIAEPKHWTVEDQSAGRLPEVGCEYIGRDVLLTCVFVDKNHDVWGKSKDNLMYCHDYSEIKPIETPEEKAARLRSEWCNEAGGVCSLGMTTLTRIYDALLSGDLPAPVKGE